MNTDRIAERVKRLRIEPIDDHSVSFYLALQDTARSSAGDEVIHELSITGTLSLPDLVIKSIEPHAHHQPFPGCAQSVAPVRSLVGIRIGPGFRGHVLQALGRTKGCTHFLTLMLDLGASHTLSLFLQMRSQMPFESGDESYGKWIATGLTYEPQLENACIALTTESPVVMMARRNLHRSG